MIDPSTGVVTFLDLGLVGELRQEQRFDLLALQALRLPARAARRGARTLREPARRRRAPAPRPRELARRPTQEWAGEPRAVLEEPWAPGGPRRPRPG
jgi:hypothetical protein